MSKLPMTTAGVRRGKAAPSSGCKSHPANAPAWMIVSGYTSINAVVKAELFPTKIRAIGVGFPYALTVSIFGGTADSVACG